MARYKLPALVALVTLLNACAGEQAMRSTSAQAVRLLIQYRQSLGDFAAAQNELNAAAQIRLFRLRDITAADQREIDIRTASWRIGANKRALAEFETLTAVTPEDLLAAGTALTPESVGQSPALAFDKATVDAAIKQLVALSKGPDPIERVRRSIAFGSKLIEAYEGATGNAASGAEAATTQTGKETPPTGKATPES